MTRNFTRQSEYFLKNRKSIMDKLSRITPEINNKLYSYYRKKTFNTPFHQEKVDTYVMDAWEGLINTISKYETKQDLKKLIPLLLTSAKNYVYNKHGFDGKRSRNFRFNEELLKFKDNSENQISDKGEKYE